MFSPNPVVPNHFLSSFELSCGHKTNPKPPLNYHGRCLPCYQVHAWLRYHPNWFRRRVASKHHHLPSLSCASRMKHPSPLCLYSSSMADLSLRGYGGLFFGTLYSQTKLPALMMAFEKNPLPLFPTHFTSLFGFGVVKLLTTISVGVSKLQKIKTP